MNRFVVLVFLGACLLVARSNASPKAMRFIGIAYDLLKGNPDGGQSINGGVDPGLKLTRKILALQDCSDCIPKEVVYEPRDSCSSSSKASMTFGTKSYQDSLNVLVSVEGSGSYGLADFAFSASSRYAEASQETLTSRKIYRDNTTICNKGSARFKTELAASQGYSVSESFAATVCKLPTTYDSAKYHKFLDQWGTHGVTAITLGTKYVYRAVTTMSSVFEYAEKNVGASVSASGSYGGYSASLSLDVDAFTSSSSFQENFLTTTTTLEQGGDDLPEPIGLKIAPINNFIESGYWTANKDKFACGADVISNLPKWNSNIVSALQTYPDYLKVEAAKDSDLKIPLTWPKGTYGLIKPKVGCPADVDNRNKRWHTGWRRHDTEDSDSNNFWSNPIHIEGDLSKNNMKWWFCMKTKAVWTDYDRNWPKGQYCIFKKGSSCPEGLNEGAARYDDEDKNNANSYGGQMPEGEYGSNTIYKYCCRDDGFASNYINLPIDKPFYLFKKSNQCQNVDKMKHTEEFFRWDCEDSNPNSWRKGPTPWDGGPQKDQRPYFCYYEKL